MRRQRELQAAPRVDQPSLVRKLAPFVDSEPFPAVDRRKSRKLNRDLRMLNTAASAACPSPPRASRRSGSSAGELMTERLSGRNGRASQHSAP